MGVNAWMWSGPSPPPPPPPPPPPSECGFTRLDLSAQESGASLEVVWHCGSEGLQAGVAAPPRRSSTLARHPPLCSHGRAPLMKTHARTHTQTTSQVFFLCLFCSPSTFSFSREKEIHGGHSAPWTPSFLSEQMMTMTIICVLHSFFFLLLLTAYPQVFNRGEKGGESRGAQCAAVNESQALVLDSSSFMLRFKKDGEGCA